MQLNKHENALFFEIFNKKEYSILDDFIRGAEVIFDIWWHIWLFSLYCFSQKFNFNPIVKEWVIEFSNFSEIDNFCIHFFEPTKESFSKSKIILDRFNKYLRFNNLGIFPQNWEKKVFINPKLSSQNSLYNSFLNVSENFEFCNFLNIEEYFELDIIDKVDILKMDIEWWEFDIILALNKDFLSKIKVIFLEYHIIDNDCKNKLEQILCKLKWVFLSVTLFESEYSNKVWYIFCKN